MPKAEAEANAVRTLAEGLGKRVEVRLSCTAAELRELLAEEVRPRILLFIGHADAPYKGEFTLGFTDAVGGLQKLDAATIADVLSNAPNLELVVLNGCHSAALGEAVVGRDLQPDQSYYPRRLLEDDRRRRGGGALHAGALRSTVPPRHTPATR